MGARRAAFAMVRGALRLPIDDHLPGLVATLAREGALVLEAPPGAGKTTRLPRALLDAGVGERGEIWVLEPRRLAARLAATRVSAELGEPGVGRTVGYTVRFEDVSSAATRVRFVTEGILVRRLVADPTLRGLSAVLLDELHERHLTTDVALALVARLRRTTRPDLAVVAMSATLDGDRVGAYLGAPVARVEGRAFPVEVVHEEADDRPLEKRVASAVRALAQGDPALDGDVLVFLPGAAEIRRAEEALGPVAAAHDLAVVVLHGDLPPDEQDRALRRLDRRKVILSTNVAESSVTIEGVVAVVDSGLARVAAHDPWSGAARLEVRPVSRASCVQRAGRAGRTRPGRCVRLFGRGDFERRPAHDVPELLRADLAETLLELATLGATDVTWLDPPSDTQVGSARALLRRLGAIDDAGAPTAAGRSMAGLPLPPRLAKLALEAARLGVPDDGALAAALLGERDLRTATRAQLGGRGPRGGPPATLDQATTASDVGALVDLFREVEGAGLAAGALRAAGVDPGAARAAARAAKQIGRALGRAPRGAAPGSPEAADEALGRAVLAAFPDRVARRTRPGGDALQLAEGGQARLAPTSTVRAAPFVVAVDAGLGPGGLVVRLASAVEPEWLLETEPERLRDEVVVELDGATGRPTETARLLFDGIVLDETKRRPSDPRAAARLLAEALLARGLHTVDPDGVVERLLARAEHAAATDTRVATPSPDVVREALTDAALGAGSLDELRGEGLAAAIAAVLPGHEHLARLAPERVRLPSGRDARVAYERGKAAWLASYLQDFFGLTDTPHAGGRALVLHLLAPNKRPVQVTQDLPSFWKTHYPKLRGELMRRYPRHAWPEDPSRPVPKRFG